MRDGVWACRGRSGQCPRAAEWTATTSDTLRGPMPCTAGSSSQCVGKAGQGSDLARNSLHVAFGSAVERVGLVPE